MTIDGKQLASWCNAIDALEGHTPAPEIKNLLICLLLSCADESPAIRESLVFALYPYCGDDEQLVRLLQHLRETETSPGVREAIKNTLQCSEP